MSKTAITGAISAGTLAVDKIPAWISNSLGVGKYFATRAVEGVSNFVVSAKHLMNAGGNYAKFNTVSTATVNQWVTQALTKADNFIVNSKDSYYTIVNMGQQVGSNGEEFIKVVFSTAGKIIIAYPVK